MFIPSWSLLVQVCQGGGGKGVTRKSKFPTAVWKATLIICNKTSSIGGNFVEFLKFVFLNPEFYMHYCKNKYQKKPVAPATGSLCAINNSWKIYLVLVYTVQSGNCFYSTESIERFKKMLLNKGLPKQTLTYDTTFDLMENVLLSVLTYRHVEFKQKPVVPLAYLFHDRKNENSHNVFFEAITKELPDLNSNKDVCMATDDERQLSMPSKDIRQTWSGFDAGSTHTEI